MKKQDALDYHSTGRPGKIAVVPTKPLNNQRDLALAYTPGVAEPCLAIQADPEDSYKYTARGNLVAVVTNGTAVLGLGNIGALAGKPVMEGKGNLFKQFADIDVFDIEVDATDPEDVIRFCQMLEPTVGGINLEDIRAPECFHIEEELKRTLNIPVFHDDQHGTAIISGAALLNALEIVAQEDRPGARGLLRRRGRRDRHREALRAAGREARAHHALRRARRRLRGTHERDGPVQGALRARDAAAHDRRGAPRRRRLRRALGRRRGHGRRWSTPMAKEPIVFALANPDPEILPSEVLAARPDAIVATGRSDYPNQVNNVLGFPFIFRGALDVRATRGQRGDEDGGDARARRARHARTCRTPSRASTASRTSHFGRDYLIPFPFDPRVLLWVAPAVAWAAVASGVAKVIIDVGGVPRRSSSRGSAARAASCAASSTAPCSDPAPRRLPRGGEREDHQAPRASCVDEGIAEPDAPRGSRGHPPRRRRGEASPRRHRDRGSLHVAAPRAPTPRYLWDRRRAKGLTQRGRRACVGTQLFRQPHGRACGDADALVSGVTLQYPGDDPPGARGDRRASQGRARERPLHAGLRASRRLLRRHDRQHRSHRREARADRVLGRPPRCGGFGIEPRVAMLSFSNFGSVRQPEAERVAAAVHLCGSATRRS